jgi:hypothetical protein
MAKRPPSITREEFREHAEPILVKLGDMALEAQPKEYASDSLGWSANEKRYIDLNGKRVQVQIGINVTVIGSKLLD